MPPACLLDVLVDLALAVLAYPARRTGASFTDRGEVSRVSHRHLCDGQGGGGRVYVRRAEPSHVRVLPIGVGRQPVGLPSWYVVTGTVQPDTREAVRAPARHLLKIPGQLRELLDALHVPEWETMKAIVGRLWRLQPYGVHVPVR